MKIKRIPQGLTPIQPFPVEGKGSDPLLPSETVSQLTRAGQKKNSFEKQKHNSIQQRYAKVGGKERGSDGVPIRESRAVRAVTGEYRRLREPGRSSTGL